MRKVAVFMRWFNVAYGIGCLWIGAWYRAWPIYLAGLFFVLMGWVFFPWVIRGFDKTKN